VARFYVEDYGHIEPFYYYFTALGPALFPWVFFLPFCLWIAFSDSLRSTRKESVFLVLWIFANLIFLSFSKAKRNFYLTPLAPAVALLIGSTWDALWGWFGEKLNYHKVLPPKLFFIAGAACSFSAFIAGNPFFVNFPGKRFPDISSFLLFIGLCCMTVSLIKYCKPLIPASKTAFASITALVLICHFFYLSFTLPIKNTYDSGTTFYKALPALVSPDMPLAYFGTYDNYALSFYANRPVIYLTAKEKVLPYMAAGKNKYLVLSERSMKYFPAAPWKVIFRGMYSEHASWGGYLLLCNQ